MALGGKTSKKFYVTSGGGGDEINSTRKTALDAFNTADSAAGYKQLIDDNTLGPLIVNLQEMQDDIDELRRFAASASELKTVIGNPLAVADGGTGLASSQPLIYSKISISAPEMSALNTTRKTLVAAPGADKVIVPVSIMIMCEKLGGSTQNAVLVNLYGGYHDGSDNRSVTRTPSHQVLGLLYNARSEGSYYINPVTNMFHKQGAIANTEYALLLDNTPGSNGATTSIVTFCYYIADIS